MVWLRFSIIRSWGGKGFSPVFFLIPPMDHFGAPEPRTEAVGRGGRERPQLRDAQPVNRKQPGRPHPLSSGRWAFVRLSAPGCAFPPSPRFQSSRCAFPEQPLCRHRRTAPSMPHHPHSGHFSPWVEPPCGCLKEVRLANYSRSGPGARCQPVGCRAGLSRSADDCAKKKKKKSLRQPEGKKQQ